MYNNKMSKVLHKHPHVEDYIEIIAGYRSPDGKPRSLFEWGESPINLARYDIKIVPSLAQQSENNIAYTDKQAKLATDLVIKYARQLAKLGVDVEPVRSPQFRLPLRTLDRSKKVFLENDYIVIKFPFDTNMVEQVREFTKTSQGRVHFDVLRKCHLADLTEYNLNWIYAFAKQHSFEIESEVDRLMSLVMDSETAGYAIELVQHNNHYQVNNACESLIQHLEHRAGGFDLDNMLCLADHAPVLAYSVAADLQSKILVKHGKRFWTLCSNRILKADSNLPNLIEDIFSYADLVKRFPIYVYEPDLSFKLLQKIKELVPEHQINIDGQKSADLDSKVIYLTKTPDHTPDRMPLLISTAGMLFGNSKTNFIQSAEKVVYLSQDVYNINVKGADICRLS